MVLIASVCVLLPGQSERYVQTALGKVVLVVSIATFAIVLIPLWINEFFEIARLSNKYQRSRYRPHGNTKHVIVCGNIDSVSLNEFFEEMFHDNHASSNLECVVLQASKSGTPVCEWNLIWCVISARMHLFPVDVIS